MGQGRACPANDTHGVSQQETLASPMKTGRYTEINNVMVPGAAIVKLDLPTTISTSIQAK